MTPFGNSDRPPNQSSQTAIANVVAQLDRYSKHLADSGYSDLPSLFIFHS